jgi:hypothetical protein
MLRLSFSMPKMALGDMARAVYPDAPPRLASAAALGIPRAEGPSDAF